MPPPFDFDDPNPSDDAVVSQFPANERASRLAITQAFEVEHHEGTGRHQIPAGNDAARDAITDWQQGSFWWSTQAAIRKLQRQINAASPFAWEEVAGDSPAFGAGTRIVFDQDTAPTGWTRDTTINDRVIRIVSGSRVHGGSWTISGVTVDSHVLTTAQMPSHSHVHGVDPGAGGAGGSGVMGLGASLSTQATGGGGSHTHGLTADGNWRPSQRDMIIASKD